MLSRILQIWKIRDLRRDALFVVAMLAIFRLAAHIPIPGVNVAALRQLFQSNEMLGLLNIFSGGSMQNFSIVMMGVAPYITASIVFQLLAMIIPKLEEMSQEEAGQQKINMWTRWLTVPLAMLQAFGMITLIKKSPYNILGEVTALRMLTMVITITAGTIFLMWIGELITEKNLGNGISLLIFAGIVSRLPQAVQQISVNLDDPNTLFTLFWFLLLALVTIVGVVIMTEGERNIPVQYARQIRGNRAYGGTSTHLPLRVSMAGVIPIIFAISVVLFPPMVAQFFAQARSEWLRTASQWVIMMFNNQIFYGVIYFILVFAFTYFYTEVIFHPNQIAENLQKQGGFIPGIRPGKNTEEYLAYITHRITFVGALFLGAIAVLPLIIRYFTHMQFLTIGGTSLLIVVAVVIEIVQQIEAQLTMREYDGV